MKGVASRLRGLAALLFLLPLCQCNDGLLGGARKMMSGHAGHHGAAAVEGEQEPMVHASPDDVFVHAERRALTGANYSDIEDDLSKACGLSKTDATRVSQSLQLRQTAGYRLHALVHQDSLRALTLPFAVPRCCCCCRPPQTSIGLIFTPLVRRTEGSKFKKPHIALTSPGRR